MALITKPMVKWPFSKHYQQLSEKCGSKMLLLNNWRNKIFKKSRDHVYIPNRTACHSIRGFICRLEFENWSTDAWTMHSKLNTLTGGNGLTCTVIFPGSRWYLNAMYLMMFGWERFISDDASCSMLWTWNTTVSQHFSGSHHLLEKIAIANWGF